MQPIPLVDLSALGTGIEAISSARAAELLEPLRSRLLQPMILAEAQEFGPAAIGICRRFYMHARSRDAVPLAQALLAQTGMAGDQELMRRASTACGLLRGDTGDIVGAIEHHIRALRISVAQGNAVEAGGSWNNLGLTFAIAGNYELANRCYLRALNEVRGVAGPVYCRYVAYGNIANGKFQCGEYQEGLQSGMRALEELSPTFLEEDPHGGILLRRNLVHLLIAMGDLGQARLHSQEVAALAERSPTARATIAAATARAAYEIATGQFDVAFTRLDQALAMARGAPGLLRDTLACVIRGEEAAGYADRALMRLKELADHMYHTTVDRARQVVELEEISPDRGLEFDAQFERTNARLVAKLEPRDAPEGWETLRRIAIGAALRVDRTGWHGNRVGALTKALALEHGLPQLEALEIGLAAELHDIGLSSVPESILTKPGELNEVERSLMERHTDAGAEILRDDREPRMLIAREIARYHHARWDGRGYPEGIGGHYIPLAARMCAIANAYDDLVCGHAGRKPVSMKKALAALRKLAGTEMDPDLVRAFETMISRQAHERHIDTKAAHGFESFQQLITSLEKDGGFA
jgi:putative two-component system response regulator